MKAREEAIYLMARALLMDMMGARQPRPALTLVTGDKEPASTEQDQECTVKIPRLRSLERRRLAASS